MVPSLSLSALSVSNPVPPEPALYKSTAAMLIPPSELIVTGFSFAAVILAPIDTSLTPLASMVKALEPPSKEMAAIWEFIVKAPAAERDRGPEESISILAKF